MPGVTASTRKKGVLRSGWTASVEDYAIAGGWGRGGTVLMVADAAGGVYAFDGASGSPRWADREAHPGGAMGIAVQPEGGTLATAGQDGRVLLWDSTVGQVRRAIDVGKAWVEHLAWSPDGRLLAAGAGRKVTVWHQDGSEAWQSSDHPSTVSALAWSGPQELASACYGRVTFWKLPEGTEAERLEWKGSLVSMVLSPNGDIIACGSQDNTVHFWRRSTGLDSMMSGYPGKPSHLAFDASGTLLATGGSAAVTVWSFHGTGPEGTVPGVLERHVEPITALAFADQAMRLASGSRDGVVVVWSLRNSGQGKAIGTTLVDDGIASLHWRPGGRALAALDARGGVTLWRVSGSS